MSVTIDSRKWCQGRVVELYRWAERLYSLRVEADIEPFVAGQFGRLGLEIEGEFVSRPYSFVNAPDERPLDFYFIVIPEGKLTPKLATLQPGDSVWVARKAAGFFTLNQVPEGRHLWMLATGTALGPFLSILKTEAPWRRFERIVLVHGVRTGAELAYQDTIQGFRQDHPEQFRFFASVTREAVPGALPMRITQAIESGELEQRAGLKIDPADSQVMICGNPAMVKDTVALLKRRGLKENLRKEPGQITTERYW
ncbi:ferredoxin/flavodoxin---NADP+ reductase [Methylomarinovum caldicuralii]|uniref:ferredoxin--NADP(+) reductase n=1 Tax=Methylomarinovum caldicuralii TaxID=438856 RepID=A0AAU9BQ60_9GAMM|nr:ferredoxin--NADP reductase [Methylomarinovum caldicuralii]BCX80561.1 ferredoxin/flavodoxin---NADP+ reductase [Methylomarinovum caldicuralii]